MTDLATAGRIARTVTNDFGLKPPLTAVQVETIIDPNADSFLPPLHMYDEALSAAIESRILQEADGG